MSKKLGSRLPFLLFLITVCLSVTSVFSQVKPSTHPAPQKNVREDEFVFQSSEVVNQGDEMLTPGDEVEVKFTFSIPFGVEKVNLRCYSTSRLINGFSKEKLSIHPDGSEKLTAFNTIKIALFNEKLAPLIKGEKKSLDLKKSILLFFELRKVNGKTVYLNVLGTPRMDEKVVKVVYPHFANSSGKFLTSYPKGKENFYLEGDPGFANLQEETVRKMALYAGTYAKGHFPDRPSAVAESVYEFVVDLLFKNEWSREELATSKMIARLWDQGRIGVDRAEAPESGFICQEYAYLFTSLVRALGIPAREVNVGLASHLIEREGKYRLGHYFQEAAAQVFYSGRWNFFDPYYELRSLNDYREHFWSYRAWVASDKMSNRSFSLSKTGAPKQKQQWEPLDQKIRSGLILSPVNGARLIRISAENEAGDTTGLPPERKSPRREIPDSLFYPAREPGDVSYPDILFLPCDKKTRSYLVKTHFPKVPSGQLLGEYEEQNSPLKFNLVGVKSRGSLPVTEVLMLKDSLSPEDEHSYMVKVEENCRIYIEPK